MARLAENSYGKCAINLTKVTRTGTRHSLTELAVEVALGGRFERLYTEGDNSLCVPTDTMKNTTYALARMHEFDSPEAFGTLLAGHFVESFTHVSWSEVRIRQAPWSRIEISGRPHEHAFTMGGTEERTAKVRHERAAGIHIHGGIAGLEVIKSSGSSFTGFLKDRYTTLAEASERIFATSIDAEWEFAQEAQDFNDAYERARGTILEVFATHESKSVQQTIFAMGEALLGRIDSITSVDIAMPNQHRILVNLSPFGMTNPNQVFVPTAEPYGLIKGRIVRS